MWLNKIDVLISRKEIRDAYDLEFLLRRGAGKIKEIEIEKLKRLKAIVKSFKITDFRTKLGSLLPAESRQVYNQGKFQLLEKEIDAIG